MIRTAVFVIAMMMGLPVAAAQERRECEQTSAPYFWVPATEEGIDALPLKKTDLKIHINGILADVTVTQTYVNTGKHPINARYIFPAGTRAAVHGMTMTVGETTIRAQIKERRVARKTFETAKSKGQSASLLEQQRPNVFSMEVANILPADRVSVALHYTETISALEGTYEFVFPTVVGPRYGNRIGNTAGDTQWASNPYLAPGVTPAGDFSVDLTLSGGMPVRVLSSPSHRIDTRWESTSTARVRLADDERFSGNRDFILRYRLDADTVTTGLLLYEGAKENHFMLLVQPPERLKHETPAAREYVFILDVSGSMHGFPLDTAKRLMENLIERLEPRDRFNIVLFAGASQVMAPASQPVSARNLQKALGFVDAQQGGGGTEMLAALETALALPRFENMVRSVVLITDGYVVTEREVFATIRHNLDRTNLFAFGIGSSVNRHLIEGVARAGQGEPFIVTEADEAESAAGRFIDYVQFPVLTGLEVEFENFAAYDQEPGVIADLFARRPVVVLGKWRGAQTGRIKLTGMQGDKPFEQTLRVDAHQTRHHHRGLPYLWARQRLSRLSDYAAQSEHAENKDQIKSLGLTYSLLTAYTSFVAVMEQPRNLDTTGRDVEHPQPLPLGVSKLAVGARMRAGCEPQLGVLLAACLLGAGIVLLRRRANAGR